MPFSFFTYYFYYGSVFDYRWTVYLVLGALTVLLMVIWSRQRDRRLALAAGVAGALLLLFLAIDCLRGETVSEQIVRRTKAMAAAVEARDIETIFSHVSERFQAGNADRAALRTYTESVFRDDQVRSVRLTQIGTPVFSRMGKIRVTLDVTAVVRGSFVEVEGGRPIRAKLVFTPETDEPQWRLDSFEVFDGLTGEPITVGPVTGR